MLPTTVKLVEVGPRDGLQNEERIVPTAVKAELIQRLIDSGIQHIEATSFVSHKKIPQLSDSHELLQLLPHRKEVTYSALAPNLHGLEDAITCGITEVGFFTTVSETFCQKNINCTIGESLERLEQMIGTAEKHAVRVRGYISCALGCPYEGKMSAERVAKLALALQQRGCYEISLGDTIGVGTPGEVQALITAVKQHIPLSHIAVHFHDTYGQALANIFAALQMGIATIDSSVAGLGGCPYAVGASGNVASEDVVYMLNGLGIHSGIDLNRLAETGAWISTQLGHPTRSRAGLALKSLL
jgi:hydroxymethylglutaryl-CoA lyase